MKQRFHIIKFFAVTVTTALCLSIVTKSAAADDGGVAFAGPPCYPIKDCNVYTRSVVLELGELADRAKSIGKPDLVAPKEDGIFKFGQYGEQAGILQPIIDGRFVHVAENWFSIYGPLSPWGQSAAPSPVTDKKFYYHPSGYYCVSTEVCRVVMQRYKEVWTLDDGTQEEHAIQEKNIPGLLPISSLIVISRDAVVDFSSLGKKYVAVENKSEACTDVKYSVSGNSAFSLPLSGHAKSFIMDTDYFTQSGGIDGLFSSEKVDRSHLQPCIFVDMQRKNKDEFALHAVTLGNMLVPKGDDLFTVDPSGYHPQVVLDGFKGFSEVPSYTWQTSFPDAPQHISYRYRPAGYFCTNDGVTCKLILQRFEERRIFADGSEKIQAVESPKIIGLHPISSVKPFGRSIVTDLGNFENEKDYIEVPANDDIFNIDADGYPQYYHFGSEERSGSSGYSYVPGNFVRIFAEDVEMAGRASVPPSIRHKTYYYRPIGHHLEPGFANMLVMQRYKEAWTLADGTTQEHMLGTPHIDGILDPITYSPTSQQPSTVRSIPQPTQAISPSPAVPSVKLPSSASKNSRGQSFFVSFWCLIKSWFGGKCS